MGRRGSPLRPHQRQRLVGLPYLIQVAQRYGLATAAGYTLQTDAAGNPTSMRLFTPIYASLTAAVNGERRGG